MKDYAKQPQQVARTIESNPKATHQASISDILQRNKKSTIQSAVQMKGSKFHKYKYRIYLLILCLIGFAPVVAGHQVSTYKFADRDTCSLWMDVYQPEDSIRKDICMLYVFGGGFVMGSRTGEENVRFFKEMVDRGYTVVAIDYRLGLKGAKLGLFKLKPGFQAPVIASEDLISATEFLISNREQLRINPKHIVLIGSSAGAITVLHTDHELSNRSNMVKNLPPDFRYAAVVSFAGAILSTKGRPKYTTPPAPTLFYHGTKDKIVVYNKFAVFRKGMYGTKSLVKVFKRKNYPFMVVRYEGLKHKVASFTRFEAQDQICDFVDMAVYGNFHNEVDLTIRDKELQLKYSN